MTKTIYFINPQNENNRRNIIGKQLGKLNHSISPAIFILKHLTPQNYVVKICDENISKINFNIKGFIAISAFTYNINRAYEIAGKFRRLGQKVIIGGIHASVLPNEAIKYCDSVAVGEVEQIWEEVLKDYENNSLKKIYSGINTNNFSRKLIFKSRHYINNIQTTRGCNNNCDFCSVRAFNGPPRHNDLNTITELVKLNNKRFRTITFLDDNIYSHPSYSRKLFAALSKYKIKWQSLSSINIANNDSDLELFSESGCQALSIGFESITKEGLLLLNKSNNDATKYKELVEKLHSKKIRIKGFFIIGHDADTKETILQTIEFCKRINIAWPHFLIYTPLPGTPLYKRMLNENRITDFNWDNYDLGHVVFEPKNMTKEELIFYFNKVNTELHSFPNILKSIFKSIKDGYYFNIIPTLKRLIKS